MAGKVATFSVPLDVSGGITLREWPRQPYWNREWAVAWAGIDETDAPPRAGYGTATAGLTPGAKWRLQRQAARQARAARACLLSHGRGFDAARDKCTSAGIMQYVSFKAPTYLPPTTQTYSVP